jgi:hypothetical protein
MQSCQATCPYKIYYEVTISPSESRNGVRFEVFKAVTMKNGIFCDVTLWALVRTDVSEEWYFFAVWVGC